MPHLLWNAANRAGEGARASWIDWQDRAASCHAPFANDGETGQSLGIDDAGSDTSAFDCAERFPQTRNAVSCFHGGCQCEPQSTECKNVRMGIVGGAMVRQSHNGDLIAEIRKERLPWQPPNIMAKCSVPRA